MVVTVAVAPPPAKVPLGPLPGAVKVTLTPLSGFPLPSLTTAASNAAKGVLICALCEPPPVAVMDPGMPAVFVSENAAEVNRPLTVAFTV